MKKEEGFLMKILYIRNFANTPNIEKYNLQEIGLAQALADKGIDVDIVYFTDGDEKELDYYKTSIARVKIFYFKALKFLSNAIYYKVLKNSFLDGYDYIISTEYNQIMTYLLCIKCPNKVILYHGPYKSYHKILESIYDKLFLKTIIKNTKLVIAKSSLAKEFLERKGFKNVKVLGVGLDTKRFIKRNGEAIKKNLITKIRNKVSLLWIGRFDQEKNFMFLLDILYTLKKEKRNKEFCLVVIGDGKRKNKKMFFDYAYKLGIINDVIYYPFVRQDEIANIYKNVDIFIFPSYYEIFGMVLLESMFFGVPVISSYNGGAIELIKDGYNGFIVSDFNVNKWASIITKLACDGQLRQQISINAEKTIKEHFTWDILAEKFLQYLI